MMPAEQHNLFLMTLLEQSSFLNKTIGTILFLQKKHCWRNPIFLNDAGGAIQFF